jgi:lipopolysaccharide export system protein LptA
MTLDRLLARVLVSAVLLAGAMPGPALAQALNIGNGNQPVEILADQGIEWNREAQTYIARGNASAKQGETTVYGDMLTAYYRQQPDGGGTAIFRYEAVGKVRIVSPTQTAVGDKGVFDVDSGVLVLTGKNLKLTTPTEVVTARDSLEYWENKQAAVARGNAVVVTEQRRMTGDLLTAYFVDNRTTPSPKAAPKYGPGGARGQPASNKTTSQTGNGNNRLQRIEGFGNVHVSTATEIVTADRGVYNADTGIAMMSEHVHITRDQNQLDGDFAEVNLNTGISRLLTRADGKANAQVRGLFIPQNNGPQNGGGPAGTPKPGSAAPAAPSRKGSTP